MSDVRLSNDASLEDFEDTQRVFDPYVFPRE